MSLGLGVVIFLVYWVCGVIFLTGPLKEVRRLPWNKGYSSTSIKGSLIDVFELTFWPYILWRVYKLRKIDET